MYEKPAKLTRSAIWTNWLRRANPQFGSNPSGNRNRSDVVPLANQINNGPMLFALWEVIQSQGHGFMPPQAARE